MSIPDGFETETEFITWVRKFGKIDTASTNLWLDWRRRTELDGLTANEYVKEFREFQSLLKVPEDSEQRMLFNEMLK